MIDWNLAIKPLLGGGTSKLSSKDILSVVEAIVGNKEKIFDHDAMHECFYSSFISLAGSSLAQSANTIPRDCLKQVVEACRIILKFCIIQIVNYGKQSSQCVATLNSFGHTISGLCAKHDFQRSDIITFTAMIKSANLPMLVKNKSTSDDENQEVESESADTTKDSDTTTSFLFSFFDTEMSNKLLPQLSEGKESVQELFFLLNTSSLQELAVEYKLFQSFLTLPYLVRYVNRHQSAVKNIVFKEFKPFTLPMTVNDALAVKNGLGHLQSNLSLVLDATKLPVLDPLNRDQLKSHTDVALSCLYASISVAVAITVLEQSDISLDHSSDAWGVMAKSIVKDGISIYEEMFSTLKNSTNFSGHVSRNFQLIACCYFIRGINAMQMIVKSSKRKDHAKLRSGKISDILALVLSSFFANQLKDVFEECNSTTRILLQDQCDSLPASLDLLVETTPTQRFLFIAQKNYQIYTIGSQELICEGDILQLLLTSAYSAFDHVHNKKVSKQVMPNNDKPTSSTPAAQKKSVTDSGSSEDEEAFDYGDDDASADFSSTDDDSESSGASENESLILGAWMVELMSNADGELDKNKKEATDTVSSSELPNLSSSLSSPRSNSGKSHYYRDAENADKSRIVFPELSTDEGVIQHCSVLLQLIGNGFILSRNNFIIKYFCEKLSDNVLDDLSAMICVLDSDGTSVGNEGICLMDIIQKLVAFEGFDQKQRLHICNTLLAKPLSLNSGNKLLLGPLSMSILAQTMLRQQQISKTQNTDDQSVVDFLTSLINYCTINTLSSVDISVEVFQLALFIFHTLTDSNKQDFFKKVVNAFTGMDSDCPLGVSRLVLLLDYLLYQYSSPSPELLQQVRWNFFTVHGMLASNHSSGKRTTREKYDCLKMFTLFEGLSKEDQDTQKVEKKDKFALFTFPTFTKKSVTEKEKGDIAPAMEECPPTLSIFFELRANSAYPFDEEKQEMDKKALAMLVENREIYNNLYTILIHCLEAGSSVIKITNAEAQNTNAEEAAIACDDKTNIEKSNSASKYCFQLSWRLAKSLPPSSQFSKMIEEGDLDTASEILVALHLISVDLKALDEEAKALAEDKTSLIATCEEKQKIKIQQLVRLTVKCLKSLFTADEEKPTLMELMVTHCVIAQTQAQLWVQLGKEINSSYPANVEELSRQLLPQLLDALKLLAMLCRSHALYLAKKSSAVNTCTTSSEEALMALMKFTDIDTTRINEGSTTITLPFSITKVFTEWDSYRQKVKDIKAKKSDESVNRTIEVHLKALASITEDDSDNDVALSLVLLQEPLFRLCDDVVIWINDNSSASSTLVCNSLVPLLSDISCRTLFDQIKQALQKSTGGAEGSKEYNDTLNFYSLWGAYTFLVDHINPLSGLSDGNVALEYLSYLEKSLSNPSMQRAMNKFFVPENYEEPSTENKENAKPSESTSKEDNVFFKGNVRPHKGSIVRLLLSNLALSTPDYSNKLLQFIAKLCRTANNSDSDSSVRLSPVCGQLCSLNLTLPEMRSWVANFELDMVSSSGTSLKEEISNALLTLSRFIVSKSSPKVQDLALTLLDAILPDDTAEAAALATLQAISPTFVVILATLANAKNGSGHYRLFAYALWWLDASVKMLNTEGSAEKMHSQVENEVTRAMATCSELLLYVKDVMYTLRKSLVSGSELNDEDDSDIEDVLDASYEHECEFADEENQIMAPEEDDSPQDEDGLWNKLCTYTVTQKKFMNQHWYHCHTCDMVDGVGVCTICAKVCHKGHDLSYAKFGSFFCDCGAKDDKSCKALVKRVPGSDKIASGISAFSEISRPTSASVSATSTVIPPSSSTSATSNKANKRAIKSAGLTTQPVSAIAQRLQTLVEKKVKSDKSLTVSGSPVTVDGSRSKLLNMLGIEKGDTCSDVPQIEGIVSTLLQVLQAMRNVVHTDFYKLNAASSTMRALKAMEDLKTLNKTTAVVDNLMVPTLGSQEGAFENVKTNFSGEQGQTIRQLINTRLIRRVAMCCLSTSAGRRQHLAVSHDKGKVTILQLSALLKQVDASKRKLTLTRLSTTAMPFAIIRITANPCNEDVLAVCGLKDCHILTFSSSTQAVSPSGSVTQHLVLHPQLATNNYLIRVVWLPASPTMLALVTAEFIKIYDLSKDILSPCYYLLLPTGKIRDATLIGSRKGQGATSIIVMSSTGHIYTQMLNEESLAVHGTFYLTNVLNVTHDNLKETGGQIGGGGVSVYYSHVLCLLFFSYSSGRNFAAALDANVESVANLFCIDYKPSVTSNASTGRNGANNSYTLYEWCEVANHPGIVTCFSQANGCPIVLMVEPEKIYLQEIKVTSSKSKVQDLVAVRHGSFSDEGHGERTTIIVLCEDGSLRIYLASANATGYWLHPRLQPTVILGSSKQLKKSTAKSSNKGKDWDTDENIGFPIDFFENCQLIGNNDLEFGGDLLQVYNPAQIKNRLNSTGMYVMDKRTFTIEITQKNSNMVITGLRILIGNQSGLRAPTYLMIEDRHFSFGPRLTRPRWFDVPLTRAESLKFHSKIKILCGPSEDPDDYNVVDSIKVYGKTKESFGWPQDEPGLAGKSNASGSQSTTSKKASSSKNAGPNGSSDTESVDSRESADAPGEAATTHGIADELLFSCLAALNCSFHESFKSLSNPLSKDQTLELISELLVQPLSIKVQASVKRSILKLFATKATGHEFQDNVVVSHASAVLSSEASNDSALVDEDSFQRILSHLSQIARQRPLNLASHTGQPSREQKIELMDIDDNVEAEAAADKSQNVTDNSFHTRLLEWMMSAFWRLLANKPRNKLLAPVCLPGLTRIEMTVKVMVDVIHAISASVPETINTVTDIYFTLLTHPNPRVSYAAKSAITKLMRIKMKDGYDANAIVRSTSKSSETPPSTRSASPPPASSSSNKVGAGRDYRTFDVVSDVPGSHASSHGTAGGTIDDGEDDDDDDEDDDDDDDEEDQEDEDDFEDIGNDDVAMEIEEQLMAEDDSMDYSNAGAAMQNNQDYFQENMLDDSVSEAAANEYSRLLMSGQAVDEGSSAASNNQGQHLAESRSLAMDMMRAMAAEVAHEEEAMDDQDHQDLENMLMGIDFPNLLPPDADDEAMVEYAIALSLQQQEQHEQQQQRSVPQSQPISAPALTSRNHEQRQREGSSSSASDAGDQSLNATPSGLGESAHVSEQETAHAHFSEAVCIEADSTAKNQTVDIIDKETMVELRTNVLRNLLARIGEVKQLGGEHCIPYFQVIVTLATSLNLNDMSHVELHRHIVTVVMSHLKEGCYDTTSSVSQQTPLHEVLVIMMRLLSIMMSKSHSVPKIGKDEAASSCLPDKSGDVDVLVCPSFGASLHSRTATILTKEKIVELCYHLLEVLYKDHWKKQSELQTLKENPAIATGLLNCNSSHASVDMTPFFLPHYVKSHAGAIFEPYLRLITEMALNLAHQVRKNYTDLGSDINAMFGSEWKRLLSEYMLFSGVPSLVRRRARKLLLYITGSKEKYREERDMHALDCYISQSAKLSKWNEEEQVYVPSLTYDELIQLVEVIKKSCEIAENRTRNWQKYCVTNKTCLPFLLDTSVHADENVSVCALKLLLCAISNNQSTTVNEKSKKTSKSSLKSSLSTAKEPKVIISKEAKISSTMSKQLSQSIMNSIKDDSLQQFIRHFLLEMNTTSIRWSAHALIHNLFKNTNSASQEKLVFTMWTLWPMVSSYGRKAAQFVDLLGYLSMNLGLTESAAMNFTDATLDILRQQNRLLSNHQNAIVYNQLANYVQFDGFYLENTPCLVCNQPEVPFSNMKLSSIKGDTKYTTTQQIIKLVGSYTVQKVIIKVTDIKRTKMIRTAVLYYNNKKVPAIVDLKNNPSMWHRAKSVTVPQGESEIRFDLPLPIASTNVMLEFTDFYENVSGSVETLQCPRCSASVQANPGICSNCGENVFQCHKCRSINYDEKDPYLCNVCGFSKYAKFDVMVTARPCCSVDSIENDEDRKKMVATVVTLLEKADTINNQLNSHKPQLEELLLQISQISSDSSTSSTITVPASTPKSTAKGGAQPITIATGNTTANSASASTPVSSNIQQLAKKYCQECKSLFEELSGVMRTVLASRSEIVEYDRKQQMAVSGKSAADAKLRRIPTSSSAWCQSAPNCYGCASSTAQQCVTLLRVLATNDFARPLLISRKLIPELVAFNLRRTTSKTRKQVHSLIGELIKDNPKASTQLNELLLSRVIGAINHHGDDLQSSAVTYEIELLKSMLKVRDDIWQLRIKAVVQLFQKAVRIQSPAVIENVTLPCMDMLRKLVAPRPPSTPPACASISVSANQWLNSEPGQDYYDWEKRKPKIYAIKEKQDLAREKYLEAKYAQKWKDFMLRKKNQDLKLSKNSFLRKLLFCPSSNAIRNEASLVVISLAYNIARKPKILDLLTSFLDELGTAGEAASRFLALYHEQIEPKEWRIYLASKGVLPLLGSLIQKEIAKLSVLEETTLNLHLQQGYALKELTEILSEIVQVPSVRRRYKSSLVSTVLNSYLSLRRLVIQRTNLVDDAQDILLELLEELTTGTESETRAFMTVCIEAIKQQDPSDLKTPQFIFERLANIIYPEETDTTEFFLSLDKDPLQEDFLQGRMVGNPYSSNESGLGPLMRDVKNKICRDCDLIALLEDDSGMELLINNKIIALDLPVRDVYKKIWLPNHNEDDAMHVVYRMRGLLGEATEDIVERLDSDKTDQNEEEVFKLASVLSECGGIEVMLSRLESVKSLIHGRQLVDVILKLLSHAVKLKVNRQYLNQGKLNTLNTLLGTLNLGLQAGEEGVAMVDQLLQIMWSILEEASADKTNQDQKDDDVFTGDKEKLTLLLQQVDSEFVQSHTNILQGLLRIIPFLSFGDPDLMQMLIDHFISVLNFEKYDESHSDDDTIYLNCFCEIVAGIQFNASGNQLKDLIVNNGIPQDALAYINKHIPELRNFDSDEWKAFTARPGLPYCLKMLTGLCKKHKLTQELVGKTAIAGLHRLEQISSEGNIGSHAENVLEALQEHPDVAKQIKDVRRQTRAEKKKKAMEVRQQQLGALGMHTNEKGQVISKSTILQQISELVEESGLTCIICREGYKFEPKKVLGIYTYTRRCTLEEFENKPRKQLGYSTVSHFNVVHYECHTSAVRMARGREEWDSALLQNASTKCNGLLPLWGAQVPEAAFASCLARHNTYIQEATGQREPSFHSSVHDLKLLLLRFSHERSFSEETGGGGRQSNINLIPYLMHAGLYVINTTRNQSKEERIIADFLALSNDKWVESAYEVDGPLFVAAMIPFMYGRSLWKSNRKKVFDRLVVVAQTRNSSASTITKLTDRQVKEYSVYKPYLLYYSLVDLIITLLFKGAPEDGGSAGLAKYIRHNDNQLLETAEKMLLKFQDELLVCESLSEFVDVVGLLDVITGDITDYVKQLFESLPT